MILGSLPGRAQFLCRPGARELMLLATKANGSVLITLQTTPVLSVMETPRTVKKQNSKKTPSF